MQTKPHSLALGSLVPLAASSTKSNVPASRNRQGPWMKKRGEPFQADPYGQKPRAPEGEQRQEGEEGQGDTPHGGLSYLRREPVDQGRGRSGQDHPARPIPCGVFIADGGS
jgi:hypothetical protein